MKTHRNYLLALLLGISSTAYAGNPPPLDVLVADATGRVVMKGRTNTNGTFSTGKLGAGNYVVQFNSRNAELRGQFAVVVAAGKKKISSHAVPAEQLRKAGGYEA